MRAGEEVVEAVIERVHLTNQLHEGLLVEGEPPSDFEAKSFEALVRRVQARAQVLAQRIDALVRLPRFVADVLQGLDGEVPYAILRGTRATRHSRSLARRSQGTLKAKATSTVLRDFTFTSCA